MRPTKLRLKPFDLGEYAFGFSDRLTNLFLLAVYLKATEVLVATTTAQQEWVQRLAPGQIRAMQRTGKKYFIYPDAPKNQIYVGGPKEYEAYRQLHPESKLAGQDGAKMASEYRSKQDAVMKKANAYDLSDPYYWANTATWADLGW